MKTEKKILWGMVLVLGVLGIVVALKNHFKYQIPNREISVLIEGSVGKPGRYQVPYGSTRFEVLQVAGVLTNSDLAGIDLYAQAKDEEKINVGHLNKEIDLKGLAGTGAGRQSEMLFATGEVGIAKKGAPGRAGAGEPVTDGEKITTGKDGVTEIKLMDGTILDLQPNSVLEVSALFKGDEQGKVKVNFILTSGRLWAFVRPQSDNTQFSFSSPHLTAFIRGTEIEMVVSSASTRVNVLKGTVGVVKNGAKEEASVSEPGYAEAFADAAKPIQTGQMAESGRQLDSAFKSFSVQKEKQMSKSEVVRILYFAQPIYYLLFEFNPEEGSVAISRIPETTPVGDLISGVDQLGKAYLYGGIDLVRTLVEKLGARRVKYHLVQGRGEISSTIDQIGGVPVKLDGDAATRLKLSPGLQMLDGRKTIQYASSQGGPAATAVDRQNEVLKGVVGKFLKKGGLFSAALLTKIFTTGQSNMNANSAMGIFKTLGNMEGWKIKFLSFAPALSK